MAPGIDILIEDRSGSVVGYERLTRVAAAALMRVGLDSGELGISLVAEPEIEKLNQDFMGRTGPTDVLSFPLDTAAEDEIGEVPLLLGDVIICPQVAARQAADLGHSTDHELCLLLIHGILHIAGYDHETDAGEMEGLQEQLLEEICTDAAP